MFSRKKQRKLKNLLETSRPKTTKVLRNFQGLTPETTRNPMVESNHNFALMYFPMQIVCIQQKTDLSE